MQLRLDKTLLSHKLRPSSLWVGFMSFLFLIILYQIPSSELSANGHQVFQEHQYWRAFTTIFVHADYQHLMMNSAFFSTLAALLHNYYGSLAFPFASLLFGGVINMFVLRFYPQHVTLVGISGVVYFMASFWLTLYMFTERKISLGRRFINSFGVALILFFPQSIEPQVSYSAHALGFLIGVPSGVSYFAAMKNCIRSREVWIEVPPENEEMINDDLFSDT